MTLKSVGNDDDMAGLKALDDSIHALAQPLTALLFRLELGALNTGPQALLAALDDARTECLRAIKALQEVRSVANALGNNVANAPGNIAANAPERTGEV